MTAPIPERHPAGRSCGTVATTLAALTALIALIAKIGNRSWE